MKVIWKFELPAARNVLLLPKGAQVLSVGEQQNTTQLWALVDALAEREQRVFHVIGTGRQFDWKPTWLSIGRVSIGDGTFIFHVFEETTHG